MTMNKKIGIVAALLAMTLLLAACGKTPQPTATEPAEATATSVAVAPTQTPAPTNTPSLPAAPDPATGQQIWQQKTCIGCHGANAQGDIGPKLAGTELSLDEVLLRVRTGKGVMPAFTEEQVSDTEVEHIYAWFLSLAPPTPTATQTATPTEVPATATASASTPSAATPTTVPTPTTAPTPTATPTATPAPTETPALPTTPDPAVGQQLWPQAPCSACHGAAAQGDIGPKLAGTGLSFDQVLLRVRTGKGSMPAFGEDRISDLELQHIYAWLRSLAPPTPTPIAAPAFPTDALKAMWQQVNDMKVSSDFAKDLPERLADDDAGRLDVLKQYANAAVAQGQAAVAQANQALNEVPNENVKATIRLTVDHVNAVIDNANQALGKGSFGEAWPHAAEMVRISRLDAWPLATQAVRDAGLVGTVRVRVTNQAGSPIAGAFVTVLTAHTPVGVRTDSSGWATIVNVAAVPALQVKAYAAGLVYHEVHVNLFPGATADASIALPGPSTGGATPSVANAAIEPSSGPGNATVTFRVTATDPQGMPNLAEDQIFALNPDLGLAYILLHTGGDQYALPVALPNLGSGLHTWYFFAVDHQCNTSNILTVQYRVQ
jgi:mono/diheme cytochrome c family protein